MDVDNATELENTLAHLTSALDGFALTVEEYGANLQSHTAVLKNLTQISEQLGRAILDRNKSVAEVKQAVNYQGDITAELREAVQQQQRTVSGLKDMVRGLSGKV